MNLIRPEIYDRLFPWREAILGVVIKAVGFYWIFTSFGLLRWIGVALLVVGTVLLIQGVQRARFPAAGDGPGVLDVDERQITYFGPGGGAAVSLEQLCKVEFDTRTNRQWWFHSDSTPPLTIPANAAGVEALFDALSALPGFDTQTAIRASNSSAQDLFVVWQKDRTRLH